MAKFDVLTASATYLREQLSRGNLTSVDIVSLFLDQIERHNKEGLKLNAVISVAPRDLALGRASELDAERALGKVRGPLHGIPIIVKV